MGMDAIIFFDLVAALFIVSAALAFIAYSYAKAIKRLSDQSRRYDDIVSSMEKTEADFMEDARNKSAEIIEESTKKAQQILNESQVISADSKKTLDSALETIIKHQVGYFEKATADFLNEYKKELENLKSSAIKITQSASKNIELDTVKEINNFDEILAKETYDGQKIVEGKIEEEFSKAQKQVQDYKTEMLKKTQEDIYKILERISRDAIGKSLNLSDHEQLIIEALEKAKKENLKN